MPEHVEVIESNRQTLVVIKLERDYHVAPRSKVLKDAQRELQKELSEQLNREK